MSQSGAPAELEQSFIYASLIVNGLFWVVLGVATAYIFDRSAHWGARGGKLEAPA